MGGLVYITVNRQGPGLFGLNQVFIEVPASLDTKNQVLKSMKGLSDGVWWGSAKWNTPIVNYVTQRLGDMVNSEILSFRFRKFKFQ